MIYPWNANSIHIIFKICFYYNSIRFGKIALAFSERSFYHNDPTWTTMDFTMNLTDVWPELVCSCKLLIAVIELYDPVYHPTANLFLDYSIVSIHAIRTWLSRSRSFQRNFFPIMQSALAIINASGNSASLYLTYQEPKRRHPRLEADITTERFLRYIRREPMTEESARILDASQRMHRDDRGQTIVSAWSDLCETGTNRSIDVSALRAWLTLSYVRLSSRRNHRSSRRRERKKRIDRHLTYVHREKFAGVDDSRAMAASLKGYCARLLNVSRGIAHTWCVARIDIGWRKRRRQRWPNA